jgi:outer membrane protein assembly factor BamE (lipoprotein component of BamABCDE complex)
MMRNFSKFLIFGTLSCLISLVGCFKSSGGFSRSGGNPFADADAAVSKNIENLMGLSVGMTKAQVFSLSGIANYVEGYDWGSVWFYKIRKGGNEGTLSDKEVEKRYMPVVFDNTDRVMGYGSKFYDQTLSDLGAGQF